MLRANMPCRVRVLRWAAEFCLERGWGGRECFVGTWSDAMRTTFDPSYFNILRQAQVRAATTSSISTTSAGTSSSSISFASSSSSTCNSTSSTSSTTVARGDVPCSGAVAFARSQVPVSANRTLCHAPAVPLGFRSW